MEPTFEEKSYLKAKKRVKELKAFYDHLTSYIIVIPILVFINIYITPQEYWFQYSALGWGIAIVIHALKVFNPPFLGRKWEERKINELLKKDKK